MNIFKAYFLDSLRFMNSYLDAIVYNLSCAIIGKRH